MAPEGAKESMKDMRLYDQVERILNELHALGIDDDAPLEVEDLTPFDQYHYHGTEAVDEAARLLGAQRKRRFRKLEKRSPAIAALPITKPICQSKPRIGAARDVASIANKAPRMVFDLPNIGCPSNNLTPPSIGWLKRWPKSLLTITGVPFATSRRSRSCGSSGRSEEIKVRILCDLRSEGNMRKQ